MSLELYATYVVACIVIILVPVPTVTLIIANSIRHGSRAGLANVAGTQGDLLGTVRMAVQAGLADQDADPVTDLLGDLVDPVAGRGE